MNNLFIKIEEQDKTPQEKKPVKENKDSSGNQNKKPDGGSNQKPIPKVKKKTSWTTWLMVALLAFLMIIILSSLFATDYINLLVFNPGDGLLPSYNTNTIDIMKTAITDDNIIYLYQYSNGNILAQFKGENGSYQILFSSMLGWNLFVAAAGLEVGSFEVVQSSVSPIVGLIFSMLPWILILGGTYWIMTKVMKSQGSMGNMSKGAMSPQISNIKFKDVAGYDEVKSELWEIVDFLKNPDKYNAVGARTPKGVLLSGPPGTGKTFFAKAIAGEASIPFFSLSGSDFVEMFVGVGAKRVRELFAQAKSVAPALIFIDELDAVGRQRGAGMGGGNDEREQTLNQLLVEMDGFQSNTGIVVIAATNRPDVLDPALKRPGRFDRIIDFRMPDIIERAAILEIYAKQGNKKFGPNVDWDNIAGRTPGFTAAQLENVVNEAAILSVRLKKKNITLDIIDEAIDRVIGGPSKSNNLMSKEEKNLIAYHESGHALVGLALEDAEKVQKITIIPRGKAGGYVLMTPKKEKFVQTKAELRAKITSYMAGRASEEIYFGADQITTGAYSDIESATYIARRMVTEFGMSDLGPIQYEKPQENVFLGRDYSNPSRNYSGQLAHEIDKEVRKLIDASYKHAIKLINANKDIMDIIAESLLIKETLTAEEAEYIYANKKLPVQVQDMKDKFAKRQLEKKLKKDSKKEEINKDSKKIEAGKKS